MVIDKNGFLQESWVHFEVMHEVGSGIKGERLVLGMIKLNLAEYVEASEQEGEEGVCRRYLMQDSKINSTLKVWLYVWMEVRHVIDNKPDQYILKADGRRPQLYPVSLIDHIHVLSH
jgi:hypothetical protein